MYNIMYGIYNNNKIYIHVFVYIYTIYIYIYIYIYTCVVKNIENVPSRLLPIHQWPHASCVPVHELPWGHCRIDNNREGTLFVFLTTYIYYAHLTSVVFEHSVCHESLLTSFIHTIYMLYIFFIYIYIYNEYI